MGLIRASVCADRWLGGAELAAVVPAPSAALVFHESVGHGAHAEINLNHDQDSRVLDTGKQRLDLGTYDGAILLVYHALYYG